MLGYQRKRDTEIHRVSLSFFVVHAFVECVHVSENKNDEKQRFTNHQ